MEKITTTIDGSSAKEFVKGTYILDYVALGIGALCVVLYVIFGIAGDGRNWLSALQLILLTVGILLIVLAIVLLNMLNKAITKSNEFKRTITYDFSDEYLSYEVMRNDGVIENGKLSYSDLSNYKETKNFIFVGLKNNTWFAIDKAEWLISFLNSKGLKKK